MDHTNNLSSTRKFKSPITCKQAPGENGKKFGEWGDGQAKSHCGGVR